MSPSRVIDMSLERSRRVPYVNICFGSRIDRKRDRAYHVKTYTINYLLNYDLEPSYLDAISMLLLRPIRQYEFRQGWTHRRRDRAPFVIFKECF